MVKLGAVRDADTGVVARIGPGAGRARRPHAADRRSAWRVQLLDVVLPELYGEAPEGVQADNLLREDGNQETRRTPSGPRSEGRRCFFVILMRLMSDWEDSKSSASTPSTATSPSTHVTDRIRGRPKTRQALDAVTDVQLFAVHLGHGGPTSPI